MEFQQSEDVEITLDKLDEIELFTMINQMSMWLTVVRDYTWNKTDTGGNS